MPALEFVAVDIETTGFTVADTVTVVGFVVPLGCRVFCRRGPAAEAVSADDLQATLRARAGEHVVVSLHDSEPALLRAVGAFVAERLRDDDVLLVAYNGERYRGGFDLPFLRTRLARTGVEWPFAELPYADLLPVLTNRFNTTVSTDRDADAAADADADVETRSDLPAVYDVLVGGEYGEIDPFDDSAAAVAAFQSGDLAALVAHNVSDILRTQALGDLAQEYCSKSDFNLKSLTPTTEAFDEAATDPPSGPGGGAGGDRSGRR